MITAGQRTQTGAAGGCRKASAKAAAVRLGAQQRRCVDNATTTFYDFDGVKLIPNGITSLLLIRNKDVIVQNVAKFLDFANAAENALQSTVIIKMATH